MATVDKIMEVRVALLKVEDYVIACGQVLSRQGDAPNYWLLSRADHLEQLVAKVREACAKAANGE